MRSNFSSNRSDLRSSPVTPRHSRRELSNRNSRSSRAPRQLWSNVTDEPRRDQTPVESKMEQRPAVGSSDWLGSFYSLERYEAFFRENPTMVIQFADLGLHGK